MTLNGVLAALLVVLVVMVGDTHSQEDFLDVDDDGRLLVVSGTTTGTGTLFPSFPTISLGTLANTNVTIPLNAALLAGLALAGLTAATITLAILLGIEVKDDKKYGDYDYGDYGYSSGSSSYATGPSYEQSSYSIKRSLEEAAKKFQ